jgi:hypothetical protein
VNLFGSTHSRLFFHLKSLWRTKGEDAEFALVMPVRQCKVTICDLQGVEHSVQVTAGSLYEAIALGLASIRTDEWVEGIPSGLNAVKVSASNVAVEHSVKVQNFIAWLERRSRSPRELVSRERSGIFLD